MRTYASLGQFILYVAWLKDSLNSRNLSYPMRFPEPDYRHSFMNCS